MSAIDAVDGSSTGTDANQARPTARSGEMTSKHRYYFAFWIFVTTNCPFCPLTFSASNFTLSPAFTPLEASPDAERDRPLSCSHPCRNFFIGPCLMVIFSADASTL
jgi:hypothetical protein